MAELEKIGRLIRGTKRFEKEVQNKIRIGEAQNDVEAQRQMMRDWFKVDRERDMKDMKGLMAVVRNPLRQPGTLRNEPGFDMRTEPVTGYFSRHKYTANQIRSRRWDAADEQFVAEEISRTRKSEVFEPLKDRYDIGTRATPDSIGIPNSIVLEDQRADIAADINDGIPVLIRGMARSGKTSMLRSLMANELAKGNSKRNTMLIDMRFATYTDDHDETVNNIGYEQALDFLLKDYMEGTAEYDQEKKKIEEAIADYSGKGKTVLEYLNDRLAETGSDIVIFMDEFNNNYVWDQQNVNQYLRNVAKLRNIHPVYVVHAATMVEDRIAQEFPDFKQHFVRPLTNEEAETLIRKPLEGTIFEFTDDAVHHIVQIAGGSAINVRELCQQVLDLDQRATNQRFVYNASDVDIAMESLVNNQVSQLRLRLNHFVQGFIREKEPGVFNEEFRGLLQRFAREVEVPVSEIIKPEKVDLMVKVGLVEKDEQKQIYRIRGELAQRALAKTTF